MGEDWGSIGCLKGQGIRMGLEHVIKIPLDIKGEVRRECHTALFPLLFMIGHMEEAVLPLPSGADVLLFQHLPRPHLVLSLGGGELFIF